jgi:excisionase family DNA binding protein
LDETLVLSEDTNHEVQGYAGTSVDRKKPPIRETIPNNQRLLVGRKEAADLLSISARVLDYLVATRQLSTRRIGSRVLIPISELQRFARADHPGRLAS